MADPTVPLAFLAGLISFASPCVLPLVPGYLSYMSGIPAGDAAARTSPSATFPVAVAFVVGFTLVFVPLGASASLLGSFLRDNQTLLVRVGGAFIVLMGLTFMGVLKIPFLYRERRFHPRPGAGIGSSVLLGSTFALGWTPCIGPTMAAVLTMAAGNAASGGPLKGALLLGVYSLGLGVPFILTGLGVTRLTGTTSWLRRNLRHVTFASGALLVVVGVLFMTDQLFRLSVWMQQVAISLNFDFWNF